MRDYMIYRLENADIEDAIFKFFLPERGSECEDLIRRKIWRHHQINECKSQGYIVTGVMYVDKETYLNARLNEVVKDYCYLDRIEQEERATIYSREVLRQTMAIIHEQKMSKMKVIASLVRRLHSEDLDVHNEIAIMLYDRYLQF